MKNAMPLEFLIKHTDNIRTIALALLTAVAPAAFAQTQYLVTSLGSLGGASAFGWGINNNGQVTGWSATSGNGAHAFLYNGGTMTDLGTLGGADSYAYGMNNNGQVVGASEYNGSVSRHAFLYSGGTMTDLGTFGGAVSFANAINDSGQVVGTATASDGTGYAFLYTDGMMSNLGSFAPHAINNNGQIVGYNGVNAVLYSGGTITDLGSLGGQGSFAYGINNYGQVAGASPTGTGSGGAFLYSSGTMLSLGTVNSSLPLSIAFGLNDNGQIVGEAYNNGIGTYHAFVYENGQMLDLNNLIPAGSGLTLTDAQAINDYGQIVANGNYGGENQAFLLTPVPEPATGALLAASLTGWAVCRRRSAL